MENTHSIGSIKNDRLFINVMDKGIRTKDSIQAIRYLCEDGHYVDSCNIYDSGYSCEIVLSDLESQEESGLNVHEYEKMKRVREPGEVERLIAAHYILKELPLPLWLKKHEGMDDMKVRNEEFGVYTIFEWIEKEKAESQAHS